MAKDTALSTNDEVKRSKEVQDQIDLELSVLDTVKELLVSETDKAFKECNIEKADKPAGVYGTGKEYGFGSMEGKYNVQVQGKTIASITKEVIYGAKRMLSDINLVFEGNNVTVQYKTTEDGIFRGIKRKDGQSYCFQKKYLLKSNKLADIKKTLSKVFFENAQKEIEYILNTRLGVQDKIETGTASTVEESVNKNKMKKLTIKELFSEDELNLSEGKKIEPNSDKIKKSNTVSIKGTDKTKMFLDDENKEGEENIDEITMSGPSGAGAGSYDTKKAWKNTPYAQAQSQQRPKVDKDYNVIPVKKESFYQTVPLEPNSGYIPKGMKQNGVQGMHNASPAQLKKMGYAENEAKKGYMLTESKIDLTKKKVFLLNENEEKGINKRYLITEKPSETYEKERWAKLSNFQIYESIRKAENVLNKDEVIDDVIYSQPALGKDGFEPSDEVEYFEKEIMNSTAEDLKEDFVTVDKPGSRFGITYKFNKKDFLNEGLRYILDLNSNTYVLNPNGI